MVRPCPSVGRIVHYFAYGSVGGTHPVAEARAAMVVDVFEPKNPDSPLALFVMTPQGAFHNISRYGPDEPGCWGWPPLTPSPPVTDDNRG